MAYEFKRADASVEDGLRRIAIEQIDKAIEEVKDETVAPLETIHRMRKRCKKLRGLIRIVRPAFDRFDEENVGFRDAARALSFMRDTEALIEACDALAAAGDGASGHPALAAIRDRLVLRQSQAAQSRDIGKMLADFRFTMTAARRRAERWKLGEDGFDAVAGGLKTTYKRAQGAMRKAHAQPATMAMHEWRKQVKYHWHHARLLGPLWPGPGPMQAHGAAADALGSALGDHHDLAVLQQTLKAEPDAFARGADIEAALGLIARRQKQLEAQAFPLGARLLAESAPTLAKRWEAYWDIWRDGRPARKAALAA